MNPRKYLVLARRSSAAFFLQRPPQSLRHELQREWQRLAERFDLGYAAREHHDPEFHLAHHGNQTYDLDRHRRTSFLARR